MADHDEPQSPIENHGIIGDMRSAALINDRGSVDFFCWPEFDSPSIFCSLLDTPEAGIFQLAPDLPNARRQQIYLPDTNVLQTRWLSDGAVVEVTDLLPIGDSEDDLPVLMRKVRMTVGSATFRMRCAVRHDYARAATTARQDAAYICFEAPGQPSLRLCSDQPMTLDGNAAVAEFTLTQGQSAEFLLGGIEDPRLQDDVSAICLERTLAFWRGWIAQSTYRGTLAGNGQPFGPGAEAADLAQTRRHPRRRHFRPAGNLRRRTQLGLSLYLDPRRLLHRLRVHAPGLRRRSQRLHALAPWAGQ